MAVIGIVFAVLALFGAGYYVVRKQGADAAKLEAERAAREAEEARRVEQEKKAAEESKEAIKEFNAKVDSTNTDPVATVQRLREAIDHANRS